MSNTNILVARWENDGLHTEFVPIEDVPGAQIADRQQPAEDPTQPNEAPPHRQLVPGEIGLTGLQTVLPVHVWGD